MRVVGDYGTVADEVDEHLHGFLFVRRALHIAVPYAGELGYLRRYVHTRINKGVELFQDGAAGKDLRADLGHTVVERVETGRFNVERDKLRVERQPALADNGAVAVHVVVIVRLKTVYDLDAVLFAGLPHIWERLRDAVVGHGDRRHAPFGGALHDGRRIGERVHRGKPCVQMQLHALFLGCVGADVLLALYDAARVDHKIVVILAVCGVALNDEVRARLDRVDHGVILFGLEIP